MEVYNIIAGLAIIDKLRPKGESSLHVRARHDKIYAGSLDWPVSVEDLTLLETLGWSMDKDEESFRYMQAIV